MQPIKCSDNCSYKNPITAALSSHRANCDIFQEWKKELLNNNKEKIVDLYVNKKFSLEEVGKEIGIPKHVASITILHKYLKSLGVSRSVKESKNLDRTKTKAKQTNLKRYGYSHNFEKNHPSRKKWEQKLKDLEGIDNVFQRPSVKKKIRETLFQKYGVSNVAILPRNGRSNFSTIHKFVVELLDWFLIEPILVEKELKINDERSYYYDIYISGTNLLIEVNGDYWHANPRMYKGTDYILHGKTTKVLCDDLWERDKKKLEFASQQGYKVFTVWEMDLKQNYIEASKILLEWIKNNDENCKNQIDKKDWPNKEIRYNRRRK